MEEEKPKKKRKKAPIKREPSSSLEMAEHEETRPKVKKAAEESDKAHKPNWRETHASKQDITAFLNGVILLRHNVITDKAEFRVPDSDEFEALGMTYPTGKTPLDEWRGCKEWQTVNDRLVNSLCNMLAMQKEVRVKDVWDVINSDFVPLFKPLKQYHDREDYDEFARNTLELLIADATEAFEILPLEEDLDLLRNILYSGIWQRYVLKIEKKYGKEASLLYE